MNELLQAAQKDIDKTIKWVFGKHLGQYRKHPEEMPLPYFVHPMGVLQLIAQWGITNVVTRKASVGHDVREDCGVTYEQVAKALGQETADVIEELTFIPDPKLELPDHVQKQEYMRSFMGKSVHALVIKVADRCCNTLDWIDAGGDYAPKYWKKADDLFSAFVTRKDQIVTFYGGPEPKTLGLKQNTPEFKAAKKQRELGEIVYTRMCYTRTEITRLVT